MKNVGIVFNNNIENSKFDDYYFAYIKFDQKILVPNNLLFLGPMTI